MTDPVIIGNATLYLGDCREILPTLQKVDARQKRLMRSAMIYTRDIGVAESVKLEWSDETREKGSR